MKGMPYIWTTVLTKKEMGNQCPSKTHNNVGFGKFAALSMLMFCFPEPVYIVLPLNVTASKSTRYREGHGS